MLYRNLGFTIVELLVVIVVIGILASVTIVSYNGIQNRATGASIVSFLNSTGKQLSLSYNYSGQYPATLAEVPDGGVDIPDNMTVSYTPNNSANPPSYTLSATARGITYLTNESSSPNQLSESRFTEEFFNNQTLSGSPAQTNEVSSVYYDWGSGGPIVVDSFSACWAANIKVPQTGNYTFHVTSDDGQRLYINGIMVVDDWIAHGPITRTYSTTLTADEVISIKYEFFEIGGGAVARLEWTTPDGVRSRITTP